MPVLEAMAAGTPVIAAQTSSLPEVAGEAALLVDPQDGRALANAIHAVFADRQMRNELAARGMDRAKMFTWERTARETLAAYQKLDASL